MPTITTFDLNTLLKLAHASYCEKKVGEDIVADNTLQGAIRALNDDFEGNSPFTACQAAPDKIR